MLKRDLRSKGEDDSEVWRKLYNEECDEIKYDMGVACNMHARY
jgi:hypothetical protein